MKNYENLKQSHPCFGSGVRNTGRIHLPVSPGCNIACRFCERSFNTEEQRPGVTGAVIRPEQAVRFLEKALQLCPEIRVAGIAGPGDPLATDYAVQTFLEIGKCHPEIMKCLSTNGLLLYERAEELISTGIDSLTVTVNAVDPEIEARLNAYVLYHGRKYEGTEGAEILIRNQLEGIRRIADAGITVKVNTVLVPGVNDHHIGEIARAVSLRGASIHNIIPLIPNAELKNYPAPGCREIERARQEAGKYMDVFRHCRHCRADAAGVPGKSEFAGQVYGGISGIRETFSHG